MITVEDSIPLKEIDLFGRHSEPFFPWKIMQTQIKICLLATISCFCAFSVSAQLDDNSNEDVDGAKQAVIDYLTAWKNDNCRDAVLLVPAPGREGFCAHMDNGEWQKWLAEGFEVKLVRLEEEAGIWPELDLMTSARAEFQITVEGELYAFYAVRIQNRWYVQQ